MSDSWSTANAAPKVAVFEQPKRDSNSTNKNLSRSEAERPFHPKVQNLTPIERPPFQNSIFTVASKGRLQQVQIAQERKGMERDDHPAEVTPQLRREASINNDVGKVMDILSARVLPLEADRLRSEKLKNHESILLPEKGLKPESNSEKFASGNQHPNVESAHKFAKSYQHAPIGRVLSQTPLDFFTSDTRHTVLRISSDTPNPIEFKFISNDAQIADSLFRNQNDLDRSLRNIGLQSFNLIFDFEQKNNNLK